MNIKEKVENMQGRKSRHKNENNIKIISLDVWNTLLLSNPEYSKRRNEYISDKFDIPIKVIEETYHKVKIDSDRMAENKSKCITNKELYIKFLKSIDNPDYNWLKLRNEIENLFAEYPPHVLFETIKYLNKLQSNDIKFSIASNTNFIRGKILNKVILSTWKIDWKFQVFSDEINKPKPNPSFWKNVISKAHKEDIKSCDIIHIGDNKICDGSCVQSNIQFKHVNNPNYLSKYLECI